MNKRPPPAARAGGAPPLPAGRPPAADAAQQASISAAWAAYYASMGAGGTPAVAQQQPAANAAQYQNYGYGAGAAPAIHNAAAAAAAYVPPQHAHAGVGPQGYLAQAYVQPQQPAYTPQSAPYVQPGYQPPVQQSYAQPQVGAYGAASMQQPYQPQGPMNGYQAQSQQSAGWQQPNAYGAAPLQNQNRTPGPGPSGNFNGPRPMRPNNPITPNQQGGGFPGPYPSANNFSPQQAGQAPQGVRPPIRPPQNGPPGQGFPPSKRPRMDGPPLAGPGIGPGPGAGPGSRNPSVSSNRGGPPGMGGRGGFHGDQERRDYPPPPASDYGGSQHSGHGGGLRGTPRGRGAPPLRGAPAGRGGRGAYAGGGSGAGYDASRVPPGSANRGRGGPPGDRGSFRGGRGGPPVNAGKPANFSANGPSARGLRDTRPGNSSPARGGAAGKPARAASDAPSVSKSSVQASAKEREQDRIKEEERTRKLKEEARRRTFTDFRIVGLEIKSLDWQWGVVRSEIDEEGDEEEEANGHAQDDEGVSSDEETDAAEGSDSKRQEEPTPTVVKTEDVNANAGEGVPGSAQTVESVDAVIDKMDKHTDGDSEQKDQSKRGEKRKAKMSSPDADDDALVASKKRPHIDGTESSAPNNKDSDKNRFRIYFDSPVAPFVPPPRPVKRKADVSDDKPRIAPKPTALKTEDEDPTMKSEVLDSDDSPNAEQVEAAVATDATENAEGGNVVDLTEQGGLEGEGTALDDVAGEEEIEEQLDEDIVVAEVGDYLSIEGAGMRDGREAQPDTFAESQLRGDDPPSAEPANEEHVGDVSMANSQADEAATSAVTDGQTDLTTNGQVSVIDVGTVEPEQVEPELVETAPAGMPNASSDPDISHPPEIEQPAKEATSTIPAVDLTPEQIAKAAADEAERVAKALKESAANTSAAYANKAASKPTTTDQKGKKVQDFREEGFRRSPSAPPTDAATPLPAPGRLSILYDNGQRRMCLDAAVIEKIRIFRSKGMINVSLRLPDSKATATKIKQISEQTQKMEVGSKGASDDSGAGAASDSTDSAPAETQGPPSWGLAKGLLLETLDEKRGLFSQITREALLDLWQDAAATVQGCPPPLHRLMDHEDGAQIIDLIAYLDRDRPLSEPKWVKTGHIDEWIQSITGQASVLQARKSDPALTAWDNKVEIVDPDAPPTIDSVLDTWVNKTKDKTQLKTRKRFIQTQFGNMSNVVQILLRLIRGESQKAVVPRAQLSSLHGPLATAVKPSAPFADQQTHATLAVLAVVNVAREYAEKSGEKVAVLDSKIAEIVKSLPNNLIFLSVDRLYADWAAKQSHKKGRR